MLFVPRLPAWAISRPRLHTALDAARDGACVVVHAPEGFGKTIAVAEWAHTRGDNGVWVTLDPSAHSRQAVWRRILRALDVPELTLLLAEFESEDPGSFREAVSWALAERAPVIVIDECDYIDDADFLTDLKYLRGTGAAGFVLIGRTSPGVADAPTQWSDSLVAVTREQLALSQTETGEVLEASDVPLSLVDSVWERAQGWPRGTRAVASALDSHASRLVATHVIDDALEQAANGMLVTLRSLGSDVVRVAQLSALVGPASGAVIKELLPDVDVEQALCDLELTGAGMWAESRGEPEFQLVPHIRTLVERSEGGLSQLRTPALLRAAAQIAEDAGRTAVAARHLCAIADWSALQALAKRNFRAILVFEKEEWLAVTRTIPVSAFQQEPIVGVLHALLANTDPTESSSRLRAIVGLTLSHITNRLRSTPDAVDQVWTTVSLLGGQRLSGRYNAALRTANSVDAVIQTLTAEQRESLESLLPVAHLHVGTTRLYAGAVTQSRDDFRHSLSAYAEPGWGTVHAGSLIALSHALDGEFVEAGRAITEVLDAPKPRSWRGTYSAAGTHLAEAMIALERGDAQGALESVDLLQSHYSTIEHWPLMLWLRGQASLLQEGADVSEWTFVDQVQRRAQRTPTSEWMNSLLVATRIDLLLASGEFGRAQRVVESSRKSNAMPLRIARARVKLLTGDNDTAIAKTAVILEQHGLPPRTQLDALLISAVAYLRAGAPEKANKDAREALRIVEAHELSSPLRTIPADEANVLGLSVATTDASESAAAEANPFGTHAPLPRLTNTELAVLASLVQHSSAADLATALYVSPNTVKAHLRSIYRKLGARSRAQALAIARTRGLV